MCFSCELRVVLLIVYWLLILIIRTECRRFGRAFGTQRA